jgi:hypothetical protein
MIDEITEWKKAWRVLDERLGLCLQDIIAAEASGRDTTLLMTEKSMITAEKRALKQTKPHAQRIVRHKRKAARRPRDSALCNHSNNLTFRDSVTWCLQCGAVRDLETPAEFGEVWLVPDADDSTYKA